VPMLILADARRNGQHWAQSTMEASCQGASSSMPRSDDWRTSAVVARHSVVLNGHIRYLQFKKIANPLYWHVIRNGHRHGKSQRSRHRPNSQ